MEACARRSKTVRKAFLEYSSWGLNISSMNRLLNIVIVMSWSTEEKDITLSTGLLWEFVVLCSYYDIISGHVLTCDSAHSLQLYSADPLGEQASSIITWYSNQSHYPDTEPTSPFRILIMLSINGEFIPLHSCLHTSREWYTSQKCDNGGTTTTHWWPSEEWNCTSQLWYKHSGGKVATCDSAHSRCRAASRGYQAANTMTSYPTQSH